MNVTRGSIDAASGWGGGEARRLRHWLVATAIAIITTVLAVQLELTPQHPMTRLLMQTQDTPVLAAVAAALLLAALVRPPDALGRWMAAVEQPTPAHLVAVLAFAAAVVVLGTRYVALAYGYSRDEAMAEFDAAIFAGGRMLAPVAPEWRAYTSALQPEFRLPVPGDVAWVSSYLPVNAAIRAGLGRFASPPWVNAILMLTAIMALVAVARRLWPSRPDAWAVAVLLLATSSQALFMAMTPYAMSAHLALNLVWLWLFLRDARWTHAAAMLVGFLASGLHQVVFHPLFVAPFMLQLLLRRRWKLSAFYAAGYAVTCVFWILYWQLLLSAHGMEPQAASGTGMSWFAERVAALLADFNLGGIVTIVQNMLRFAAWQNPLLLVLGAAGTVSIIRSPDTAWPLVAGLALTLAAMFVLLPYQGTGWGYRYLHGLIGNAALVSAVGWMSLTSRASEPERDRARGVFVAALIAATVVLMPVHALQMRGTHAPYARASAAIAGARAGAVIVDTSEVFYGNDLVRNDPFLRNVPLVFDLGVLEVDQVRELCGKFRIALFSGTDAARFGISVTDPLLHPEADEMQEKKALLSALACGGEKLGGPE